MSISRYKSNKKISAILDFKMAYITCQQASGRIEFLRVGNVGVGVKIVILCYSEAEIHAKYKFMAAILDFKMADITCQTSQWQNRISQGRKCGCRR